jgi:hypothetical protein
MIILSISLKDLKKGKKFKVIDSYPSPLDVPVSESSKFIADYILKYQNEQTG